MVKNKIAMNTAMLYLMNIAKLIFPFVTLPYLTRVLSVDGYATVSYVKSSMQYMQLIVDFGFMLSGTTAIVNAGGDKRKIGDIVSNTILAKLILAVVAFVALLVMCLCIPLLRQNVLYTLLSFVSVFLSVFLVDYLFRGLEQMQEITFRFVAMKAVSTALTFVFVHNDSHLLWIPVLDIIGTLVALVLVWVRVKKYDIVLCVPKLRIALEQLRESFRYFISDMATTAFGALNTVVIGIVLPTSQIALWSVVMQIVSAVQILYNPITNGIYPEMVRSRSSKLLKKTCLLFMPIVVVGCIALFFLSRFAITVVSGEKYLDAVPILRWLIPVLLFSFPAMLFGWPALGAIGRVKETTITTVVSAVFQCVGIFVLVITKQFTLVNLAIMRGVTELVLLSGRALCCLRYRNEFN